MGKKRVIKKSGSSMDQAMKSRALSKVTKKKLVSGKLYVEATYNNTKLSLTDISGNVVIWSSSGALGFKGAKKGTPFAASKVGDLVGEKAAVAGIKQADVVIKGVGSGRESAVRSFMSHGIEINNIQDKTPVPHNGPKAKKPRRI
jgi:small subunit ribosomal protein S11